MGSTDVAIYPSLSGGAMIGSSSYYDGMWAAVRKIAFGLLAAYVAFEIMVRSSFLAGVVVGAAVASFIAWRW